MSSSELLSVSKSTQFPELTPKLLYNLFYHKSANNAEVEKETLLLPYLINSSIFITNAQPSTTACDD